MNTTGASKEGERDQAEGPIERSTHAAARPAAAPQPSGAGRRGKILVVDDEPALGSALRRVLRSEHDVEVASSVKEALDLLGQGRRFDAILCDLMMPEQTGADLHAELRRSLPEQAVRMVFLTGGAFTPAARDFLASIDNLCLEKPFDPCVVRALVSTMIRD